MKEMTPELLNEMTTESKESLEFAEKFKPKKTTDDCFTPPAIYDVVADWVAKEYNLDRENFVRPFYPGGDYENYPYKDGDVVVDNPPFSLSAQIYDFYYAHGIKFFLFTPGITTINSAFKHMHEICIITAGVGITYDNGAIVNTSFATNLETEFIVRTAPDLYELVNCANIELQAALHKKLPKYVYSDYVFTSAMGNKYSKYGIDFRVKAGNGSPVRHLDAQKKHKKTIYGGGLLLSEKAAAEKAAAEKAAAEKAAAEKVTAITWELSDRERDIIQSLG